MPNKKSEAFFVKHFLSAFQAFFVSIFVQRCQASNKKTIFVKRRNTKKL